MFSLSCRCSAFHRLVESDRLIRASIGNLSINFSALRAHIVEEEPSLAFCSMQMKRLFS